MNLFTGEGPPIDMQLVAKLESAGWRHYLNAREVHCGDHIEIQLGGLHGSWICVRYQARLGRSEQHAMVVLYAVGGRIYYDDDARFRWPKT